MSLAVEAKGIVKVYEGKTKVLDDVNLQVQPGKVFALLGPNGAGKTTLMRILTTQLHPTSGEARVMGLDTVREASKVRQLIGYVPQEMSVWTDISGYENMLVYSKIYGMPSKEREVRVREALESVGLGDVGDKVVRLYSGGMIRRLEIACALLTTPKMLFLDEPTIGLDPMARKVVWEKLLSFKEEYGTTVFFNTHYMDEADLYADEIGIISQGKIVTTGSAPDLKHSVGVESLLLELSEGAVGGLLVQAIRDLPGVREVTIDGQVLKVAAESAESALPRVMRVLDGAGVGVEKVSMGEPTLDDVFFKYAGARLEAGTRISEIKKVRMMVRRG